VGGKAHGKAAGGMGTACCIGGSSCCCVPVSSLLQNLCSGGIMLCCSSRQASGEHCAPEAADSLAADRLLCTCLSLQVHAREAGIRAVVFNSRGTSGSPVTSAQFYSASFTEDMR
jgi:hypothetical protein